MLDNLVLIRHSEVILNRNKLKTFLTEDKMTDRKEQRQTKFKQDAQHVLNMRTRYSEKKKPVKDFYGKKQRAGNKVKHWESYDYE